MTSKSGNNVLSFAKMHGLGNDFMVIDGCRNHFDLNAEQIQKLAHRQLGIGFDQLLLVEKTDDPNADFAYRIFNADGAEVGQCGNGARCLAKFIALSGLSDKKELRLQTQGDIMLVRQVDEDHYRVELAKPKFIEPPLSLSIKDQQYTFYRLDLGNPHAVTTTQQLATAPLQQAYQALSPSADFPDGVNVGFIEIKNEQRIALRVFERGAGETAACGSGACAAALAAINYLGLQSPVTVAVTYGELIVDWPSNDQWVALTGPASLVYQGQLDKATL